MKTQFYEIHRTQGARFTQYQGWNLPDQFTSPAEEYEAVRRAVGLIDVSYRATFRLSGPERVDFLHRVLSNDIKRLSPGSGCPALLLTAKGKIIAAMNVLATADALLIETEPAGRQPLVDTLRLYQLMQKVNLEDVTEAVVKLLVQGPRSTEFLSRIAQQDLSLGQELQHQECRVGDRGAAARGDSQKSLLLRVVRVHETGETGYELMAPADQASQLWGFLRQAGTAFGLKPVGFQAFNTLRVEAGIPWAGVDMNDTHFPQEARMDHALDWDKGCYIGYEPVARIKFRGHINKKLVGLKFPGDEVASPHPQPESGSKIIKNGRQAGHVTSATYSLRLNALIALGYVQRELFAPGTEVTVETAGGVTPAVVAELPFVT